MDDANPAFEASVADLNGRPATVVLPALKKQLENGKGDAGKPLSAEDQAMLPQQIAEVEKFMPNPLDNCVERRGDTRWELPCQSLVLIES